MTTITLRSSKGSPLTNSEVDSNFSNLNNDKVEKTVPSAAGNLAALDASGQITDSGVNPNTKANKKTPSAAGNIASLDATGDLSDSGIAPSDVTNKTDKVAGAAAGNLAALDASGNLTDSTYSPSDFQPADPDIPTVAATTAEMQAGIETALRSMSPKNVADAIAAQAPATWDFESSPIPFTGASGAQKISAAHGLGVTPKKLEAVVRCLTASEGFSPGDEVSIVNGNSQNGSIQLYADSTNVYGLIYNQNYWWTVLKDGSSTSYFTSANWAVVLRAKK